MREWTLMGTPNFYKNKKKTLTFSQVQVQCYIITKQKKKKEKMLTGCIIIIDSCFSLSGLIPSTSFTSDGSEL